MQLYVYMLFDVFSLSLSYSILLYFVRSQFE